MGGRAASNAAIRRPDLGMAVMEYVEQAATMGLIGLELMPIFRTVEQSGTYPVIPKEALLKLPDTARAPRAGYQRGDWTYERGKFSTSEHGWEEPVDDSERKLFDAEAPGLAGFVATRRAMGHVLKSQEKRIADKLFSETYLTATGVGTEWDSSSATPVADVNDAVLTFRSTCGMLPDTLTISYPTFVNLRTVSEIVDKLKYTFPGIDINKLTSPQLAAIFNIPRVLVGGAVYDSAKYGTPSSITDVWSSEYALLSKTSSGPDLTEPGIGRTFLWTEDSPANSIVEEYREEDIRSDVYRVRHNTDERLMYSEDTSGTAVSTIYTAVTYLMSNIHTAA